MPSRQNLPLTLAKARQQLQKAQSRVAALEAQLMEGTPPLADLAGSADRYHRTLDTMLEGCQLIGFDWRYLYINDTAARHGQRTKDELLGYTMMERYPGIEQTALFAVLQRCMQERQIERIEHEFTYPDGTAAWFELSVQPVPEGIFILSLDISERKQAAENIRKLHRTQGVLSDINQAIVRIRHLPSLFEKVCEIAVTKGAFRLAWIGLFDPKSGRLDPAASAGIAASDLEKIIRGLNTPPLLPALRAGARLICNNLQTDPNWLTLCAEALRLGCRATVALPLVVAGEIRGSFNLYAGETDFFDEQEMRLMDEMAEDISFAIEVAEQEEQRLNAEAALRLSEEKYRTLIESSESVIAVFDGEGTFLFANRVAAAGLALTPEILIGRKIAHLFSPPTAQEQLAQIRQVIQSGEGTIYEASRVVLGEARWYRSSIQPIRDVSGEITSALVNAMDITHLKRAEADLRNERDTLERKVAERTAALQAALSRVEAILHNSPDAILLVDADLTIQQTNQSFNTLFGATWNEDLGQSLRTLFHPDDIHTINNLPTIAPAQQNGNQLEVRAIRKDGTTFDAELNIGVIKDDGLVCIIRDITERKAQERQLRYHASLQESVSDAVIVIDMENNVQSWNKAAEDIYGWTATEAVGQQSAKFLHYEVSPEQYARDMRHVQEHGWVKGEISQFHKDGHLIHIWSSITLIKDEHGKPLSFIAVNHDISERKAQERQLRYHASIQENVSDAVIVTDMELRIQSWNEAAARTYGWTAAEAVGKVAPDFLQIRFPPATEHDSLMKRFNKEGFLQQETIQRRKDGTDIFILGSVTLLNDEKGVPVGVIAINHDITARKAYEHQLRYHASIQASVSDAVIATDMDFRIQSWNRAAEQIYGWGAAEAIGQSVSELLQTIYQSAAERERIVRDFFERGTWQGEVIQHHRDGRLIPIQAAVNLFKDETGQPIGLVAVNRDITEPKQAAAALQQSAAEIHDLYNHAPCGYHSINQDGLIVQINDTELQWLGYTREEVIGRLKVTALFTPESMLIFQRTFPLFIAQGWINDVQLDMVRKDGRIMHILLNATAIYDDEGQYLKSRSTLFNITELQQTQRALVERETHYRLLAENISDVIGKTNADGIRTFITPSCYALLGYTPDELIGQPSIDIIHPDDRLDTLAAVRQAVSDRKTTFSFIRRFRHKAGYDVWVEITNNIIYNQDTGQLLELIGVLRDVSARKLAEVELREAEHRYHALFEQAHDAVFLLDMQGNHIESNHRAADMLGYPIEELQTLSFRELSDEIPESKTVLERLLAGESVPMYERVMRKRDGSRISVEINVEIVRDLAGQPRHIQSVVRDITARKQAEESLRESEERFRHAILDAPFPIMIHADNGEVLHISNVWAEISGYTHTEIPTMAAWIEKAYRENSQIVRPLIEKVYTLSKPRRGGEFRIWTKAGEERIWDFISAPLAVMPDGRRMVSSMAMDVTDRKQAEAMLQNKMAEERQFQVHLKALHEIIIELTGIDQLDTFYQRAVELGRERLGFERLTMFLYDAQDDSAVGTYGTDIQGNLVDERGVRFTPDPNGIMQRSFDRVERFYIKEETTLYNDEIPVGYGWNAAAALWNGTRNLGWFVADNLLRHGPASKPLLDIMGLYALSVGTLLAQKQTQLALKESEALYRLLAENISDLIMRSTLTSECLYVSPSVQTLLGYTPEELSGQPTFSRIHPDDQPIIWAAYASALERNDLILPHQYRARHKAGHYIWLETVGKPLFRAGSNELLEIITSSRDITARKQAEAAVRESEARYRLLAENLADVIMTFSPDRQITYMSPSCEKLLGYLPAEVEGKAQSEFIHPADYPHVVARTRQAVVAKEDSYTNQFRIRHKAGHYIWYEVRSRVVWERNTDKVVQFVSVLRDITERKEAEDALRESEEKFRMLLDAAPVATIISDQAGRISLVNGQAESLFGYPRNELTGQLVEVLVPDYISASHRNNRMTYIATPRVRPMGLGLELHARRKGGREVPVEIELSYINTRDGIMVMSFIMDITDRKRIAAELEQQRSFLRNVIDVSPNIIFVKDYDGRFVLANSSAAAIYNTTIEVLVGKTDADFCHIQQEADYFLSTDRRVITSGEMLFIEEPFTNSTGKVHWLQTTKVPIVSADGKSKYVLGVSTDITERKEAEEALRASEEKYRSLVETMRGGLAVFDTDFRTTFVNDRFCELLGYTRAEIIGQQPLRFVEAADIPFVQSHLERRQNAESTTYEIPLRRKDGQPIYLLMSGSPLLDQQGNYNGSIVVATDITIQKQAEATLRQALAKEKELGDLKTRFVSMASHEFRTPLATILAVVETLSIYRHKLSEEQIDKRFDKIKDQVGHLKDIMEDVLMLARMQARHVEFNPVPLDLAALLRSVLDEFQSQSERKHQLEYTVDEGLHEILLDRKLMRQLISNLVSNAIKYSPAETVVRIQLSSRDAAVILTVSDQGIGIPEADLPHLFEPFHRAANVGTISGTGLGLVITREAVELHGGTITVESQQGVGTTFHVRIPISTGDNPLSLAEAAPPATAAPS